MPPAKDTRAKTDVHLTPVAQAILAIGAVSVTMTIVGAAIFGTPVQSDRAFRLFKDLVGCLRPRSA